MPVHGPQHCKCCWPQAEQSFQEQGPFRLVRDPGHWGAAEPHTLVLGISKGNTQAKAYGTEPFDGVGFKNIRIRMLESFQAVGLLLDEKSAGFERRFTAIERDYAFASVVRCSLTGLDRKKGVHTADSPNVLPAFRGGSSGLSFVENCVKQHLVDLPDRTRLVLLLGNADDYVSALREVISRNRSPARMINPVAYWSGETRFIHLAHPSKGNGHFGAFIRGEGKQGVKRDWARRALAAS